MILAKGLPAKPTPAMSQAYTSAVSCLTRIVPLGDAADYEMLGVCQVMLGDEASASETFKAGLAIERQRDGARASQLNHSVVDLPRQQPQREADHAALMIEHPLDREVGLACVRRPEYRDEPRSGTQHGHTACIGSERPAGKGKPLKKRALRHWGPL